MKKVGLLLLMFSLSSCSDSDPSGKLDFLLLTPFLAVGFFIWNWITSKMQPGSEQDKELAEKSRFASTPKKIKTEVSSTTYSGPPKIIPLSERDLTPEQMKKLTGRILDAALRKKAEKYNLVTAFFGDLGEYLDFITDINKKVVINDENTCVASLEKKPNKKLLYTLACIPENKFITETIPNFIASPENIVKFNKACLVFASRLATCIELDDENATLGKPSAFADLDVNK